jgi:hypothetical protein
MWFSDVVGCVDTGTRKFSESGFLKFREYFIDIISYERMEKLKKLEKLDI